MLVSSLHNSKQLFTISKLFPFLFDELQALADDELDELFVSMPPRVGKTSLLMFFITWIMGRDGEATNLYSAFSDTITSAMYTGVYAPIIRSLFNASSIPPIKSSDIKYPLQSQAPFNVPYKERQVNVG